MERLILRLKVLATFIPLTVVMCLIFYIRVEFTIMTETIKIKPNKETLND